MTRQQTNGLTIPVMFGDGRVRSITYSQAKNTHLPNLVITEIGPIKEDILRQAELYRVQGKNVDEVKVRKITRLITELVLEASEALAYYGNHWPKETESRATRGELLDRWSQLPNLMSESRHILDTLINFYNHLDREEQSRFRYRLGLSIEEVSFMAHLARFRRDNEPVR